MSRVMVGKLSSVSSPNDWPGPIASCVTFARVPVMTMPPPPVVSAKSRLVLPCRLMKTSLTVWLSKPPEFANTV